MLRYLRLVYFGTHKCIIIIIAYPYRYVSIFVWSSVRMWLLRALHERESLSTFFHALFFFILKTFRSDQNPNFHFTSSSVSKVDSKNNKYCALFKCIISLLYNNNLENIYGQSHLNVDTDLWTVFLWSSNI